MKKRPKNVELEGALKNLYLCYSEFKIMYETFDLVYLNKAIFLTDFLLILG